MFTSRTMYSVIVFIMSMILIFITKPKLAFDKNGNLKKFGINDKSSTVYSVGVLSVVLAVLIFYLFCIIDLIFE